MRTMGSLFAGIGGFDLGFERAGFKTLWQVEIDPYCRKVLAKHFREAERFEDVRECGKHNLRPVDVICGGFPCQDISNAGKRAGIEGERSGLWSEFARIIGELRPRFVVVENVAALLGRGIGRVLGDLAEIGYDAEWEVISAADVGAPHLRERVWIVAYADIDGQATRRAHHVEHDRHIFTASGKYPGEMANATGDDGGQGWARGPHPGRAGQSKPTLPALANTNSNGYGRPQRYEAEPRGYEQNDGVSLRDGKGVAHPSSTRCEEFHTSAIAGGARLDSRSFAATRGVEWWATEPDVGRVAYGIPARVDRLKGLGNAVVPQIPELIARRLMVVPA